VAASRPEIELLLCCARSSRDPETADRIGALLEEKMDWEYLLRKAGEHGMRPLLYWHLDAARPELVPEAILEQLRNHFRANNMHNLSLTAELLRLLEAFKARELSAVPFKGPVLSASAYGNLALREFVDLDILVRKRDIPEARESLLSIGYRQLTRLLTDAQEAAFLESRREYVFARTDGAVVELHWAVAPRLHSFSLDTGRLWERLGEISLGGNTLLTLSPEDSLLILCMHGSKHLWHRLAWVCDVAELIRASEAEMDWEWLMGQASASGGERMLLLGLFLANDLLGAPLPKGILRRAQTDPAVKTLAARVRELLFQDVDEIRGALEGPLGEFSFNPRFIAFRVKMRERLRDKVRYLIHAILVPPVEERNFLPLPRFFAPFYYVLWPIRRAWKYIRKLSKRPLR
jgi:hypothetical protein